MAFLIPIKQVNGLQTALNGKVTAITSTVNAVAKFSGITGQLANSGVLIDASNNLTVPGNINVSGDIVIDNSKVIRDATLTNHLLALDGFGGIILSIDALNFTNGTLAILDNTTDLLAGTSSSAATANLTLAAIRSTGGFNNFITIFSDETTPANSLMTYVSETEHKFRIGTAPIDIFLITSGGLRVVTGRVGIGTTASARLHVKGEGTTAGTKSFRFENSDNTRSLQLDDQGGLLGINIIPTFTDNTIATLTLDGAAQSGITLKFGGVTKANLFVQSAFFRIQSIPNTIRFAGTSGIDKIFFTLADGSEDIQIRPVAADATNTLRDTLFLMRASYWTGVNNNTDVLIKHDVINTSGDSILKFTVGAAADAFNITSDKNIGIGTTLFGTSAVTVLSMVNGTAPSTSPLNIFQMYSADIVADNAAPHFRAELGDVIKLFKGAVLTAPDTSITHTAPGTPDFAIQDLVDSGVGSAFGFATKDEGNTALQVILNLQIRVNELESRLQASGQLT